MVTSFEELVAAMQPVPQEATAHRFLFTERTEPRQRRVTVTLDELSLIPMVEAIGVGLEWCRDRIGQLSEDAVLDALQLLKILDQMLEGLSRNGAPVNTAQHNLVRRVRAELAQQVGN